MTHNSYVAFKITYLGRQKFYAWLLNLFGNNLMSQFHSRKLFWQLKYGVSVAQLTNILSPLSTFLNAPGTTPAVSCRYDENVYMSMQSPLTLSRTAVLLQWTLTRPTIVPSFTWTNIMLKQAMPTGWHALEASGSQTAYRKSNRHPLKKQLIQQTKSKKSTKSVAGVGAIGGTL